MTPLDQIIKQSAEDVIAISKQPRDKQIIELATIFLSELRLLRRDVDCLTDEVRELLR